MGYFAAKSSSIEFVREGDLEKLYFHLDESKKMSQIYRNRVLDGLNWSSAQDKVRDFIEKFNRMKGAMRVQEKLKSKWYAVYIADGTAFRWQVAIMSLTYLINLIMMVGFSLDTAIEPSAVASTILPGWYDAVVIVVGVAHVLVSFGVVMQYFVNQSTNEGIKVLLTTNMVTRKIPLSPAADVAAVVALVAVLMPGRRDSDAVCRGNGFLLYFGNWRQEVTEFASVSNEPTRGLPAAACCCHPLLTCATGHSKRVAARARSFDIPPTTPGTLITLGVNVWQLCHVRAGTQQ